jgi:flagellar biosynthesis/type III secretory pathway chaperone
MTRELEAALAAEAALYERLLALCEEKRGALVGLKTGDMDGIAAREEALLAAVSAADGARQRAAAGAAERLALAPGSPLREIARAAALRDSAAGRALAALRDRLTELLGRVARANDLNRALAEQSLDHVHGFLRALAGAEPPPAYTRRGGEPRRGAAAASMFDSVA